MTFLISKFLCNAQGVIPEYRKNIVISEYDVFSAIINLKNSKNTIWQEKTGLGRQNT